MDPREFCQLASELARGTRAVELRTAISRAYYATYHVSVSVLEEMGFRINKGAAGHGDVQMHLSHSGDTEIMKVGSQLTTLHSQRIRADYRLDKRDVENQKTASALVQQASHMIQVLDGCRAEPRRSQIITAIQNWKRNSGAR